MDRDANETAPNDASRNEAKNATQRRAKVVKRAGSLDERQAELKSQ